MVQRRRGRPGGGSTAGPARRHLWRPFPLPGGEPGRGQGAATPAEVAATPGVDSAGPSRGHRPPAARPRRRVGRSPPGPPTERAYGVVRGRSAHAGTVPDRHAAPGRRWGRRADRRQTGGDDRGPVGPAPVSWAEPGGGRRAGRRGAGRRWRSRRRGTRGRRVGGEGPGRGGERVVAVGVHDDGLGIPRRAPRAVGAGEALGPSARVDCLLRSPPAAPSRRTASGRRPTSPVRVRPPRR